MYHFLEIYICHSRSVSQHCFSMTGSLERLSASYCHRVIDGMLKLMITASTAQTITLMLKSEKSRSRGSKRDGWQKILRTSRIGYRILAYSGLEAEEVLCREERQFLHQAHTGVEWCIGT